MDVSVTMFVSSISGISEVEMVNTFFHDNSMTKTFHGKFCKVCY